MGFMKSRVYVNRPRTIQDLKTNIQEEIANIAPAMLAGVMTNTRNRFTQCMENRERHLPDEIFKTNYYNIFYVCAYISEKQIKKF